MALMSSLEMTIDSWGRISSWNIWDKTGRVLRSPPKCRKFSLQGRKSIISRRMSIPSAVVSFLGTPNIPPSMGAPSTCSTSLNGIIPHNPRPKRPSTTLGHSPSETMTFGGFTQLRNRGGFNHCSELLMKSLKPPMQTSLAGKMPATPSLGRLWLMFSHRTLCATWISTP